MNRSVVWVLVALALRGPPPGAAQGWRLAAWGGYDGVTGSPDWRSFGGQLTWSAAAGHAVWAAVEALDRFGERDASEKLGVVVHPSARWWASLEAGTAIGPELVPKNSWELDVTARATTRLAAGVGYRRQNYVVGAVDLVMPHASLAAGGLTWDARMFVTRNPSRRTDAAGFVRATRPLSGRVEAWVGGGGGRESYLVGAPPVQEVRSLETLTGTAGVRVQVRAGFSVRVDGTVVRSRPVLSRRGFAIAIERRF